METEIKIDTSLLTGQEHRFIGSTPPYSQMWDNPFVPQAIFERGSIKKVIKEVKQKRQQQEIIISHEAAIIFGIENPVRLAAVLNLPELAETGETVEDPKLIGIYDSETGGVIRDGIEKYSIQGEFKELLWIRGENFIRSSKERLSR